MSEEKEREEEKENEVPEEEVQKHLAAALKEKAEQKVREAQPVSRAELAEILAKRDEDIEDLRELLTRATAQNRAVIKERDKDNMAKLKKEYAGTIVEQYL